MQENKLIKALVLNAQLGNNSAFEQLYQMTIQQIYILTTRLSGNLSAAGKLTKIAYVNAWQTVSQKDEKTTFANWLKKITAETVLSEKSKNNLDKLNAGDDDHVLKEYEEIFFNQHPLEKAIRNLEFDDKLVFTLHDLENMSYEDISKITGKTINELKSVLTKARESLIILVEE